MSMKHPFAAVCLFLGWLAAGCGPASPPPKSSLAYQQAYDTFQSLCVTCHGTGGHGDGPGSVTLDPKPRNFADVTWQSSITDEQIIKTVTLGGAAVGKNANMPAQPQLKGQAEVLTELVGIVRDFRGR